MWTYQAMILPCLLSLLLFPRASSYPFTFRPSPTAGRSFGGVQTRSVLFPSLLPSVRQSSGTLHERQHFLLKSTTVLYAKKKAGAAPAKKFQVKLLKHVPGTGSIGQIVQVSPAFYNNKLRPTNSAEIISDDEVERERQEQERESKERQDRAAKLQKELSEINLKFCRKAGPDGHLFGGIGPKTIMLEIHKHVGDDFVLEKNVKLQQLSDSDGKKIRGDIKHTGSFEANISLLKDVSAKVTIEVDAEE